MLQWKDETAQKMLVNQVGEVTYLTFSALTQIPGVVHGFSTRLGGVSKGFCESMNLSYTRGDDPADVTENFHRIADAMGFPFDSIVCSDQTHTANVRKVSKADCGNGITKEKPYRDVDGMITDEPGVTLATFYADCVPLYLVDPKKKAIGLSHSGWRGTAERIGKVTVEAMVREYGSDPKDMIAAIGPSICQDCYEVSKDVVEVFEQRFSSAQCDAMIVAKENGKYQLDLEQACRYNFIEAGVLPEHISGPNLCTCCNPEVLFSHRASAGKRGNLAAFLSLI